MNALTAALADPYFSAEARRVANRGRIASRRMGAAIRRGALFCNTLAKWKRRLDYYRSRGDWLSALDFLREYGAGIDSYCQSRSAAA